MFSWVLRKTIHLMNKSRRFCGHLYPGGTEKRSQRISYRREIGPGSTVKRDLLPLKNFQSQAAGKGRGDALTAKSWQDINTNLPHIVTIRRAARQTDELILMICPNG